VTTSEKEEITDKYIFKNNLFTFSVDIDLVGNASLDYHSTGQMPVDLNDDVGEFCDSDNPTLTSEYINSLDQGKLADFGELIYEQEVGMDITITKNYFHWTFAQVDNRLSICAVGGYYPIASDNDYIVWVSSCSGGRGLDATNYDENAGKCDDFSKQFEDTIKFN